MKKQILTCLFLISVIFIGSAQDSKIPKLEQRVTDLTNTLSGSEIASLQSKLASVENEKGSQVTVLIIPTTGDETIEQYSIRVVDAWKVGREDVDDGVLFLVAMSDRKMRIEVGYGLEGAIPDALAKRIITNVVTPDFRSGHYYAGIDGGVDVIIGAINGEELPPAVRNNSSSRRSSPNQFGVLLVAVVGVAVLFGVILLNVFLKKKFGNTKGSLITALVVFVLGWLVMNLGVGLFLGVLSTVFLRGSNGGRGGRGGGFYGGGFYGGGGGFSGGGGGGFSGGGGGFGGGGASGGW